MMVNSSPIYSGNHKWPPRAIVSQLLGHQPVRSEEPLRRRKRPWSMEIKQGFRGYSAPEKAQYL